VPGFLDVIQFQSLDVAIFVVLQLNRKGNEIKAAEKNSKNVGRCFLTVKAQGESHCATMEVTMKRKLKPG
jgi:hypothetical protein